MLNACIDDFEGWVSIWFSDIQDPDLGVTREEMATLRVEVRFFT